MNLDQIRRQRAMALANGETQPRAKAKQEASGTAKVFLDDVIDSWGWPFGISAKEFRQTLDEITAETIELHINSPGGEATEGVAMFTALRQHDAKVTVMIDGLAASAASLVAMAGDEVVMSLGTTLMIHDAWGLAMGNADDMADAAARLNTLSDGYADIYAEHTSRPVDEMRALMRAEKWLNPTEAIEQGFADRKDDRDGTADNAKAQALAGQFDLTTEQGRELLTSALDVAQAVAALADSGIPAAPQTPSAEPVATSTTTPTLEVTVADAPDIPVVIGSVPESPPTIVINNPPPAASAAGPDHLAEITRLSAEVAEMREADRLRVRDQEITGWLTNGQMFPHERERAIAMYDVAPAETRAFFDARAVGSAVPVAAIGHEGDGSETNMREYEALYGKGN